MAQGLINNGVLVTKNFTNNELELLVDYTVSGSAVTQVDFTSLNIQEDEEVILVSNIVNGAGSSSAYYLYVNGNTTNTNYYAQYFEAYGTALGGNRFNYSSFDYVENLKSNHNLTSIKLTNNAYCTYQSNIVRSLGTSNIMLMLNYTTSTFTIPSITKISIVSQVANTIGIGSRFQLYKVKGQVQQTWATT